MTTTEPLKPGDRVLIEAVVTAIFALASAPGIRPPSVASTSAGTTTTGPHSPPT